MNSKNLKRKNCGISKVGHEFLDKVIDKLPIELHLPNYRFCGPVSVHLEKEIHIKQLKHFYYTYIIHTT